MAEIVAEPTPDEAGVEVSDEEMDIDATIAALLQG
jgi:hypothetical protein